MNQFTILFLGVLVFFFNISIIKNRVFAQESIALVDEVQGNVYLDGNILQNSSPINKDSSLLNKPEGSSISISCNNGISRKFSASIPLKIRVEEICPNPEPNTDTVEKAAQRNIIQKLFLNPRIFQRRGAEDSMGTTR